MSSYQQQQQHSAAASLLRRLKLDSFSEKLYQETSHVDEETGAGDYAASGGQQQYSWADHRFQVVGLDVVLPNGILLPVQCPPSRSLASLKQEVFIRAKRMPLGALLGDSANYVFKAIGLDAIHIELFDEQKPISSLGSLLPLLQLIEPEGNKQERELNQSIGTAMGVQLRQVEGHLNEEYTAFRIRLYETCCHALQIRGKEGTSHYHFPAEPLFVVHRPRDSIQAEVDEICEVDLDCVNLIARETPSELDERIVERLRRKIEFSEVYLEVWYLDDKDEGEGEENAGAFSVRVKDSRNVLEKTPTDIIELVLGELTNKNGLQIPHKTSEFLFQIAGRRVFITQEPIYLTQFEYIRSCFENYRIPKLIIRPKAQVFAQYTEPPAIFEPTYIRKERHNKYIAKNEGLDGNSENKRSFWDLDENLSLTVHSASHITVSDTVDKMFLRAAVVVGRHVLDARDSTTVSIHNPRWPNGLLEFSVYLKDLPACALLSFALIATTTANTKRSGTGGSSSQKGGGIISDRGGSFSGQQLVPVGWTNVRLFDWRNRLNQGKRMIPLWPYSKELLAVVSGDQLGPLQYLNFSVLYNTSTCHFFDSPSSSSNLPGGGTGTGNLPCVEVHLPEFPAADSASSAPAIVEWPSEATVQKFIGIMHQRRRLGSSHLAEDETLGPLTPENPDLERLLQLRRCLDTLRLTDEDQAFLWRIRSKVRRLFPQMLPILADCAAIWAERERICELYHLLDHWPPLHVETAIELLDARYVDRRLRRFAVEQLDAALNNDQLQLYLLVLVQALRYEPHADSDLARMLLTRALLDYRVGSMLFWLLRSELAQLGGVVDYASFTASTSTATTEISPSSVSAAASSNSLLSSGNRPYLSSSPTAGIFQAPVFLRFALILEAYCRGNALHLPAMIKQVEMIATLTAISARVRSISNRETMNKVFKEELAAHRESLQNLTSPLNSTDQLGEMIIDECRVMSSAKQPLLLTWSNPECMAEISTPTHQLIFKNGDDMRQDMLTLRVMRIMDAKWKSQNNDYCLTLYEVLPVGKNIGLIKVVQDCQTLFQIQNSDISASTLNMDIALLNTYIYKKCSNNEARQYLECVDRFTSSLVGYCVATYVLGIKDRHQDNIMLAQDGRIFHIDFGHFLGHTKRKLGINRERTDFVLTDHFLFVISKGKHNFRQTYEYTSFREECTKGFMVIHYHARFFIVLFRMMLCMGLPELASPENVDFLRQSLMYDKVERDEARAAFQQILGHVVKGDWSVKMDWFFHSVNHSKLLPSIHQASSSSSK